MDQREGKGLGVRESTSLDILWESFQNIQLLGLWLLRKCCFHHQYKEWKKVKVNNGTHLSTHLALSGDWDCLLLTPLYCIVTMTLLLMIHKVWG